MNDNIRILVLAEDYSNPEGKVSLHYIHTRNIEYIKAGIEVDVLNFSTKQDYFYEGVRVISELSYKNENIKYDKVLAHAPNIKNHYRFLNRNIDNFTEIIMFFHGHEVLKISEAYPEPYSYISKPSFIKTWFRDIYDGFKFKKWKEFIIKNNKKLVLVFVSEWMLTEFIKNVKISTTDLKNYHIIHNSVGNYFEDHSYDAHSEKEFDFVTIRSSLDGSKYCADVVRKLALKYPSYKFLVVGKGAFFNHFPEPTNLILINRHLSHEEIIQYLNKSRYSLLPTRTDSQGVMACEMMTFGIPLITSNIPVCKEMFHDYDNVYFIDNDNPTLDYSDDFWNKAISIEKPKKFMRLNTVNKEIDLIKRKSI